MMMTILVVILPRPSDANDDEDGSKLMVDSSGSGKVGNQFQDLVSAALAQVNSRCSRTSWSSSTICSTVVAVVAVVAAATVVAAVAVATAALEKLRCYCSDTSKRLDYFCTFHNCKIRKCQNQ